MSPFAALAAPAPSAPAPLQSYSGDPDDDAPTRLYAPSSPSAPPPAGRMTTRPRNERPIPFPVQAPGIPQFTPKPSRRNLYLIGGAIGVIVAVLAIYFGTRSGTLLVSVAGPGGHPIDSLEVFIDGAKRCDASPCLVKGLAAGAHLVRASAKGYQETAEQAVAVENGQEGVQTITLSSSGAGTGMRVSALGSGLKLWIDGQEFGELPQTAKGLAAGEHTLRIAGSDRYQPWEDKVTLSDGEIQNVGPVRLRVLKGLATFKAGPGADGARVLLDGRLVPELPATIEVPAGKQLTLLATKTGYSTYKRTISFNDGVAEKTFEITMVEGSEETPVSPEPASPPVALRASGAQRHSVAPKAAAAPAAPPVASEAKGKATLNLNSIPVSNVILNGRPLGPTPKIGVQVPPGPQTVVFVHPDFGRKVMSAVVAAGETKTLTAKMH
jgi:serine/threonine-protein kinase